MTGASLFCTGCTAGSFGNARCILPPLLQRRALEKPTSLGSGCEVSAWSEQWLQDAASDPAVARLGSKQMSSLNPTQAAYNVFQL